MIATPSNFLSLIRGSLAFIFLSSNPYYRCVAIILAMLTDGLDGYLARKMKMTSKLGAILDPLMDKFFVCFILVIFIQEGRLQLWEAATLLSRDLAVLIFGTYLVFKGTLSRFQFQSIWMGKITTTIQFFILLGIIFNITIPLYVFFSLIVLGFGALIELCLIKTQVTT